MNRLVESDSKADWFLVVTREAAFDHIHQELRTVAEVEAKFRHVRCFLFHTRLAAIKAKLLRDWFTLLRTPVPPSN